MVQGAEYSGNLPVSDNSEAVTPMVIQRVNHQTVHVASELARHEKD